MLIKGDDNHMRKPLIAGNWKMHGSLSSVQTLANGIKDGAAAFKSVDILVLPVFVHLSEVARELKHSSIMWGAQDLYPGVQGAFTGEVAGPMLAELGCRYVLAGHSERRALFNESSATVATKVKAALDANLTPILCVGETREQREADQTEAVVREQIQAVIDLVGIDAFSRIVIAYEPVWAIGTGLTATPEQAQAVHVFIRQLIAQNNVDIGGAIRILYGGSMKAENANALLAQPDIDGGLIGGAALDAASFLAICQAAENELVA